MLFLKFSKLFNLAPFFLLFSIHSTLLAQYKEKTEKPNIILINVDDLGYGDLGCYGATLVKTPNIDKLAKEGRRFTDFHTASSVCSPSRYALITGRYPAKAALWNPIFLRHPLVIDPDRTTIADIMKQAGYSTAIVGKWHLGFGNTDPVDWNKELKPGPLELGFDYYYGVPVLNSHPPFVYVENHHVVGLTKDDPMVYNKPAETRWMPEKFGLEEIGGGRAAHALYDDRKVGTTLKDTAVAFIKKHKDNPFFLYYATTNIHHPFMPAPRFIGTSQAGRYGDFIQELDWLVGEIIKTLEDEGLTDNTLLILTSDNGGMLNQGGQHAYSLGHHLNDGLLGFKFDAWEGGHRVPLIVRWPGKVPAGTVCNDLISNVDFLATMAAIVGHTLKEGEGPDSYNMLSAFIGTTKSPIRETLVISPSNPKNLAIRHGKWMFIGAQGGGGFTDPVPGHHAFGGPGAFPFTGERNSDIENGKIKSDAPPAQLYNLAKDLYERENIYNKFPKVAKQMRELLQSTLDSNQSRP